MKLTLDWDELEAAILDWVDKHHPTLDAGDAMEWTFVDGDGDEVENVAGVALPTTFKTAAKA